MGKTKEELLKKYSNREPTHFAQYDVFGRENEDSVIRVDSDGDSVWVGNTWELMTGYPRVRVLISDRTAAEDAARALNKIADLIRRDGRIGFTP